MESITIPKLKYLLLKIRIPFCAFLRQPHHKIAYNFSNYGIYTFCATLGSSNKVYYFICWKNVWKHFLHIIKIYHAYLHPYLSTYILRAYLHATYKYALTQSHFTIHTTYILTYIEQLQNIQNNIFMLDTISSNVEKN